MRFVALALVGAFVLAACTPGGGPAQNGGPGERQEPSPSTEPSPLVDPDEIVSGGPPPDGIPPIDDPNFIAPDQVDFLEPTEPVLAVEVNEEAKAYPLRILTWHEIVNDVIGGDPVAVTYCPLCNTGIAFRRPTIDGELLDFGTSGKLLHSNLVMYDRQTGSYWAQATGQAIVGQLTGHQLELVPARILSWGDWMAQNPDGLVLSTATGVRRDYGVNPYYGYDSSERPFLFSGEADPRMPALSRVLGVSLGGEAVAFPYEVLSAAAVGGGAAANVSVGGSELVVLWQAGTVSALDEPDIPESRDVGSIAAYERTVDGRALTFEATRRGIVDVETGSRWSVTGKAIGGSLEGTQLRLVVAIDSFWFDWAAFNPETEIYEG